MPYEELKTNVYIYAAFSNVMESAAAFNTAIEIAGAIARRSPDGNLSPRDTEELIAATSDAQGKLALPPGCSASKHMGFPRQSGPTPKIDKVNTDLMHYVCKDLAASVRVRPKAEVDLAETPAAKRPFPTRRVDSISLSRKKARDRS
jgi:hypothetical protein